MRRIGEIIILVLVLSAGCSYVGKQVSPYHDSGPISQNSGHHRLQYEHVVLDYDYSINRNLNTITCDGVISFRNIHQGFNVKGLHLMVMFLDSDRVIIETQNFFLTNLNTWQKTPFTKEFAYKSQYKHISFSYSFQY